MKKILFLLVMFAAFVACSKDDEEETSKIPVEPIKIPVESIKISHDSVKLSIGEEVEMIYTIFPENTTEAKEIEWHFNPLDIIEVDTVGNECKIKALKDGQTLIIAKLKSNQNISDTCYVNVLPIYASRIELNKKSMEMYVGDDSLLTAKIFPENVTYKEIEWNSSDDAIATVNDGRVVGISAGDVVITVKSKKDNVQAQCNITVKNILVSNVGINELKSKFMINEELQLTASIFPENAFNKNFKITSSDNSIIRIDDNNKLYALSKGECVITISSEDGGATASYNVEVIDDITYFINLSIRGSYSSIFGYVTGEIYCKLENYSSFPIKITSMTVFDGNGNILKTTPDNLLGTIEAHSSSDGIGGQFTQAYYPKFVWEYEYSGQTYQAVYDFKNK